MLLVKQRPGVADLSGLRDEIAVALSPFPSPQDSKDLFIPGEVKTPQIKSLLNSPGLPGYIGRTPDSSFPMSSRMPSEGVFYVLFMPTGWTLHSYRFADMPETDHSTWWEQSLAQDVASEWSKSLGSDAGDLARSLRLHYTGFPRGRVAKVGRKFHVYHGANFSSLAVQPKAVEQAFCISGKANWVFDEHEQSLEDDCEAIRGFLRISQSWPTVQ